MSPTHPGVVVSDVDGKARCEWVDESDPELVRYHDEVWGTPTHDPAAMFESLTLGVFQAGLNWLTVFHKRDAFRKAFRGFDPERVAAMTPRDVEKLMTDEHIIRNRAKIEATVNNAVVDTTADRSLPEIAWSYASTKPHRKSRGWNDITENSGSVALSAELKAAGYKFVGPTSVYSFMQNVGIINDHVAGCFRA